LLNSRPRGKTSPVRLADGIMGDRDGSLRKVLTILGFMILQNKSFPGRLAKEQKNSKQMGSACTISFQHFTINLPYIPMGTGY